MTLVTTILFVNLPDWIIPRGEYKFREHSFLYQEKADYFTMDEYVRTIIKDRSPYRKIVLPVCDPGTENSYEIQVHRFSNSYDPDCTQVTLYQFVGAKARI